jgi:hypothetical protein
MKSLIYLICILNTYNYIYADDSLRLKAWVNLSAASQNTAIAINNNRPGGMIDPGSVEPLINAINDSIEQLTKDGFLTAKSFKFRQEDILTKDSKLSGFINQMSVKYGHYTALCLMDMGISHMIRIYKKDELVELRVFLPQADMIEFEKYTKSFAVPEVDPNHK